MIKVSDVTEELILKDEIAFEAARAGILNLSAYAESIKPQVEELTFKKVQTGSIIVALSRLVKKLHSLPSLRPKVEIEDLRIKSPLFELTYNKTPHLLLELKELKVFSTEEKDFFVMTQGLSEVTVICSKEIRDYVLEKIQEKPKARFDDLVAISVRFNEKYLKIPNVIHALVAKMATGVINIIEIISTYTELTFIIDKKEMKDAIESFS